ncbi:conjugative transposon protein TraM [Allomuricauda sp. F6463D]|uniref:conjugative transposon protein TraM n=1 Tax=Allomuricauda sp. F6463D TaxID=2926409 RepID=UPI001FF6C864|nr:conjugative transposon protein TraM [Muricauda sp. F6463D]MCK0162074.1 conjugative transposon protein TraM [Muricauda sp. F6463D]
MKLQQNKIVFVLLLACVVLFITAYSIMTFGKDTKTELDPDRIPVPDLKENNTEYASKLEALEAIEEERESSAPSMYPDHMVDDKGYFNPDYMEYEKHRIIDSILETGQGKYPKNLNPKPTARPLVKEQKNNLPETALPEPNKTDPEVLGLEHQLFFASNPETVNHTLEDGLKVRVDGMQTIREGHRLDLRLSTDAIFNAIHLSKNTRVYGFVKIRPNRVMIEISQIGDQTISLKGYDAQDRMEGIYVENHLRGEIAAQSLDKTIGAVNIPGIPQLGGIKGIFRKDNRAIKVSIPNNYQLTLKP